MDRAARARMKRGTEIAADHLVGWGGNLFVESISYQMSDGHAVFDPRLVRWTYNWRLAQVFETAEAARALVERMDRPCEVYVLAPRQLEAGHG